MGITKTEKFTAEQNEIGLLAKAIGHPARIAILQYLIKTRACVCGDLVDELPLSQSTVSQHLKELKNAGLIHGTIEGPRVCYCINNEVWNKAKMLIHGLFETHQADNTNCC